MLNLEKEKVTNKLNLLGKAWKRQINKVTFVGENFTRKPPKYERFIRPTGLRFKKAHGYCIIYN